MGPDVQAIFSRLTSASRLLPRGGVREEGLPSLENMRRVGLSSYSKEN
jgi:hypothetical protein